MGLMPVTAGDTAMAIVEGGRPVVLGGGRRFQLDGHDWARLVQRLGVEPVEVVSLWSDGAAVHALCLRGGDGVIASVPVEAGRFLGLSGVRPALSPHERMIRDLWGFEAMDARDLRPLLDHGDWSCSFPLAARPGPAAYPPEPAEFPLFPDEAAGGAVQLGSGPVGTPVGGPAHLRLVLDGDRIRRVDPLLGFAHRGVAGMMRGSAAATGIVLASRIDASISVACQCAFAEAVERIAGLEIPARARTLRTFAAALEAAARGTWSLARLARVLNRPEIAAAFTRVRGELLDAVGTCFGHRLMFDALVAGGMSRLAREDRLEALGPLIEAASAVLAARRGALLDACERGAREAGDRVGMLAERRCAATVRAYGTARDQLRAASTTGPVATAPGDATGWTGEGIGAAASIRGVVRCWIRLAGGTISAFHLHDPGLAELSGVWDAAGGSRMDRFEALCAAADVTVPGMDQ